MPGRAPAHQQTPRRARGRGPIAHHAAWRRWLGRIPRAPTRCPHTRPGRSRPSPARRSGPRSAPRSRLLPRIPGHWLLSCQFLLFSFLLVNLSLVFQIGGHGHVPPTHFGEAAVRSGAAGHHLNDRGLSGAERTLHRVLDLLGAFYAHAVSSERFCHFGEVRGVGLSALRKFGYHHAVLAVSI